MPKKKELPKLYKREWLNTEAGSAYIIIEAEVSDHWSHTGTTLDANIQFKDCNKQIDLEFYCSDEKDFEERIKKIDRILEAVNEVKAFMLANPPKKGRKKNNKRKDKSIKFDASSILSAEVIK